MSYLTLQYRDHNIIPAMQILFIIDLVTGQESLLDYMLYY